MSETRKIAAILRADVVGYSRLAGADEDRILALLGHSASGTATLGYQPFGRVLIKNG
jgi:hypothetical protein